METKITPEDCVNAAKYLDTMFEEERLEVRTNEVEQGFTLRLMARAIAGGAFIVMPNPRMQQANGQAPADPPVLQPDDEQPTDVDL